MQKYSYSYCIKRTPPKHLPQAISGYQMAKPYTPGHSGRLADLFMNSTKPVTVIQDEWCPYSLTLVEASVNEFDELTIKYNTAESYPWKGRGPRNQRVHQDYQDSAAVDSWLDDHREVEKDMRDGNDFDDAVRLSARGTQKSEDQQVLTWKQGDEARSSAYVGKSDNFTCSWTSESGGECPALMCTLTVHPTRSSRGMRPQVTERVLETSGGRGGGSSDEDSETNIGDESDEGSSEESIEDGGSVEESDDGDDE